MLSARYIVLVPFSATKAVRMVVIVVKEINSNGLLLCLTEMSVECEDSLISHEWYFRESD